MGYEELIGDTDVQEGAPTPDQLSSILEYLGPSKAGSVVEGATGSSDALRKFKQNDTAFQRPVTVDWSNGRAGEYSRVAVGEALQLFGQKGLYADRLFE